jgi:hypothetical protein
LRFLLQSAIQPEPVRSIVSYDIRRHLGGYAIFRDGEFEDMQFDPAGVLKTLYARVQRDALSAWPGAAVLRAVTGRQGDERFVVVGESLWDRSRLALALMAHGIEIEGDDLAVLHDGVLTGYPRPLRVCGVDARLPALAPPRQELPFLGLRPSTGSWALDLALTGVEWRITTGAVDTVVLLESNHGGQTRITQVPRHETARVLMSWCDPLGDAAGAIRAVAQLADGARCCYRLWLGELEDVGGSWPGLSRDTLRAEG